MIRQSTIRAPFSLSGVGLHTGRRSTVTVRPAPEDHGRCIMRSGHPATPTAMTWANRVPSVMSTSIALADGSTVRTVEHLMASLAAFAIDNALVQIEGDEIPILDGSARPWCRELAAVGSVEQAAPRRFIRVRKPVQVVQDGGFLRVEPAASFAIDMTYDLLHDQPILRWAGPLTRDGFVAELAASRSFGRLNWRKLLRLPPRRGPRRLADPPVHPHLPDAALMATNPLALWASLAEAKARLDPKAPVLRGVRPGRAVLVVDRFVLPSARLPDEPVRHVALDLIGDLALAGAPLLGKVVAHTPSHEKTYMLVAALMSDPAAWDETTDVDRP